MANPTTNYGFVLPTSSDLVTDLPADFDVALQGVDTRLKALQPGTTLGDLAYSSATANTNTRLPIGTTGQVLAVSGGVPAWTTTSDVTPLTTKGDLFTFTTVDARLGIGANNTVLTADSAEATGMKWATPAAGGMTLLSTTTLSGATTTISSISQDYKYLIAYILGVTNDTANGQFTVKPNNASLVSSGFKTSTASFSNASPSQIKLCGDTAGFLPVRTVDQNAWTLQIDNYASTTQRKPFQAYGAFECTDFEPNEFGFTTFGFINTTSAITSLVFANAGGNLAGGTVLLYGGN